MIKPLYLLADSQLLFERGENGLPSRIRAGLASDPKAAYIGASNADNPEFYALFKAAMEIMNVSQCRMVPAQPADEDNAFLQEADLMVLAGGDVERGWQAFEQNGVKELISRRRYEGTTLVGVSAGAVQLGLGALTHAPQPKTLNLFRLVPFYVGAHDEDAEWFDLRALVNLAQPEARGIGIPAGGGAVYCADGTLEPIRRPLIELVKTNHGLREGLLLPSNPAAGA
jgi:cyanophycinase